MTELDAILDELKEHGVDKLVWDGSVMTLHYRGKTVSCEVEAFDVAGPETGWTDKEIIAASTSVAEFCLRVFRDEVPWPESWGTDPRVLVS